MDADPGPSADDAKRYWNAAANDNAAWYIATGFTSENDAFFESGSREADEYLDIAGVSVVHGSTLVELGCGAGRMTRRLAELAARVKAVDISSEMLSHARKNLEDLTNIDYVEVSGEGWLPFDDDSVDAVFSYITMQHVPHAEQQLRYLAEGLRITAPGGWVLMQFRRGGPIPRVLDWVGHLRHVLSGRRTLSAAWRGARVPEKALLSLGNDQAQIEILRPSLRHIWVLARPR